MNTCFRCQKELPDPYWHSSLGMKSLDAVCFEEFKLKNKHYKESDWYLHSDLDNQSQEKCCDYGCCDICC